MKEKVEEYISYLLNIITFIVYFVLLFTLDDPPGSKIFNFFAFVCFGLGITFLILSFSGHIRKAEQGILFQSGVYGIVRHPMYLGAALLFIAMAFFIPFWVMILLATINVIVIYRFMLIEERKSKEKFGEAYQRYMAQVPRANFITGFMRWVRRSTKENK